jgi:hypothetical protein
MKNPQSDMRAVAIHKEPRLTVLTLMWAGFWTGVLLCGFVLLLR